MSRRSSACPASRRRRRRCSASTRTRRSTTYTNASKKLWRDLLDLQPRTAAGGGGITRDEYIANVASDIQAKQPTLFDLNKLRKELEADGFSPVFVVLVQELERWEKLNIMMNKSLVQLKRRCWARSRCRASSTRSGPRSSTASCP